MSVRASRIKENSETAILYMLYAKTHLVERERQTLTHAAEGRGLQAMDGQPRCRKSLLTKQNRIIFLVSECHPWTRTTIKYVFVLIHCSWATDVAPTRQI